MDNIVLIGFMGVGKTEVGKLLAKNLGYTYVDTDSLVEKEQKRSINDIFSKEGEQSFRDMESETLAKLKGKKKNVISTGGGIILRPENIKKLKELGPVILLWADQETIYSRIKNEKNRPLLNVTDPKAKIKEILDFRTPIYKNIADFEVDTSALSPDEACNRILGYLRKAK
jgi:shikimate kinase